MRALLARGTGIARAFPEPTLDRLVAARAKELPDALAVLDGEVHTTYRALMQQANGIIAALRANGVNPGAHVAVCADRSALLVAAVIAISALGATYVPLDGHLPSARLDTLLADAKPVAVCVTSRYADRFSLPKVDLDAVAPLAYDGSLRIVSRRSCIVSGVDRIRCLTLGDVRPARCRRSTRHRR